MKELFYQRCRDYFPDDYIKFIELLKQPCTQGFFLNTRKASKEKILSLIDFPYSASNLSEESFYHECDNIGKTKAYELGLIYPQEIAASLSTRYIDQNDIHLIVDMCSAPGGKTINVLNRIDNHCICICNDVSHNRALILSSNLERLGLDNVVVTNKKCDQLAEQLNNKADLVILDAPCSGEGMIRKYPEILDDYSLNNIVNLAQIQRDLLENAYDMVKEGGTLIYSTCTYAFEEDELQIKSFLEKHDDMKLIPVELKSSSTLSGTVKLSPLNNTEGQFFAIMRKTGSDQNTNTKYLKTAKEKIVEDFIKQNFDFDNYYLYKYKDHFYLSLIPLPDLGNNVIKYGIYLGDIFNKRFEPNHNLYRANSLIGHYRYTYELNDEQYDMFISGNEIKADLSNNYYLITYKGLSLGFGKCSNNTIKNKYPKGLRRMI